MAMTKRRMPWSAGAGLVFACALASGATSVQAQEEQIPGVTLRLDYTTTYLPPLAVKP